MNEYRLNFQYNKDHWSTIFHSDNPARILEYVEKHEQELIDAIEASDQCLYIEQYCGRYPVGTWKEDNISKLILSFQFIAYPWLADYLRLRGK